MKSDEQLLAELKEATEGLTFMSESDYPLEVVHWEELQEITHHFLRQVSEQPAAAPVRMQSVDEFFHVAVSEAKWKSTEQLAVAKRYQILVRLLKDNLKDLKVYRIGEVNIPAYVVGRSASGKWAGVSTRVVET